MQHSHHPTPCVLQGSTNNALCFLGPSRKFSRMSRTQTELVPGQGHFGPDAIPGVSLPTETKQSHSQVSTCWFSGSKSFFQSVCRTLAGGVERASRSGALGSRWCRSRRRRRRCWPLAPPSRCTLGEEKTPNQSGTAGEAPLLTESTRRSPAALSAEAAHSLFCTTLSYTPGCCDAACSFRLGSLETKASVRVGKCSCRTHADARCSSLVKYCSKTSKNKYCVSKPSFFRINTPSYAVTHALSGSSTALHSLVQAATLSHVKAVECDSHFARLGGMRCDFSPGCYHA